jgi:hypothetical protein
MAQIDPVADAIAEADHADAETRYRNQLGREMFELGWQAGFAARQAAAEAARQAAWEPPDPELVDQMQRLARDAHARIEEARWGPGGREHFADPRPGDFPGRGAQALPERESGGRLMPGLTMTPSGSGGGMAVQADSAPGGGMAVQSRGGSGGGLVASGPEGGIEVEPG